MDEALGVGAQVESVELGVAVVRADEEHVGCHINETARSGCFAQARKNDAGDDEALGLEGEEMQPAVVVGQNVMSAIVLGPGDEDARWLDARLYHALVGSVNVCNLRLADDQQAAEVRLGRRDVPDVVAILLLDLVYGDQERGSAVLYFYNDLAVPDRVELPGRVVLGISLEPLRRQLGVFGVRLALVE